MLDLSEEQLAIVRAILAKHAPHLKAWAFGSHVTGAAKRFSDPGIALESDAPIPMTVLGDLREAFQENDLPFGVDLLDLRCASPSFRRIAMRQRAALSPAHTGTTQPYGSATRPRRMSSSR